MITRLADPPKFYFFSVTPIYSHAKLTVDCLSNCTHQQDSCFPKSLKLSTGCGFRLLRLSVTNKDGGCIPNWNNVVIEKSKKAK